MNIVLNINADNPEELLRAVRYLANATYAPSEETAPEAKDTPAPKPKSRAKAAMPAVGATAEAQPEAPVILQPVVQQAPAPAAPAPLPFAPAPQPPVAPQAAANAYAAATLPAQPVQPPMAAPAAPQAPAANFTAEQVSRAGTQIVDMGRQAELVDALHRHGLTSIAGAGQQALNAMALELRAMGAAI